MGRLVVVNHGVDRRDNIGVCGHPLWLNGVYCRDNIGGCHYPLEIVIIQLVNRHDFPSWGKIMRQKTVDATALMAYI